MTCILKSLDVTILAQTSVSTAVIAVAVESILLNTAWYYGEIELVTRFITNLTYIECILVNTILPLLLTLVSRLEILVPGLCNFSSKVYVGKPQILQLLRVSYTVSKRDIDHI